MTIKLKEHRIDVSAIYRYSPNYWTDDNKRQVGSLNLHFKSGESLTISYNNASEIEAIVEYLDEYASVKNLRFVSETEVKSRLIVE